MKIDDALMGLAPGFALPCTKKYDGKNLTFEFSRQFNDMKLGLDTSFNPATSGLGNTVKGMFQLIN